MNRNIKNIWLKTAFISLVALLVLGAFWFFTKDLIYWAKPLGLCFLLFLPLSLAWNFFKDFKGSHSLRISSFNHLPRKASPLFSSLRNVPLIFQQAALAALILAFARPQAQEEKWRQSSTEGIDIVISMDVSSSMLSKDFKPNRLEVSKEVAQEFVLKRKNDRMGLVIYGGNGFLQCPLTTDHHSLSRLFSQVDVGMIKDGTSITSGLNFATDALMESQAKSKVIILLTDGVHNIPGENMSPKMASETAASLGIRIYTIGVGSNGKAPSPYSYDQRRGTYQYRMMPVKIDEELLGEIAEISEGKYFRATDKRELKKIYREIDRLEKTKITTSEHVSRPELFHWFLIVAMVLLALEWILKSSLFKTAV